jgi:glutamate synthase (NADPH/NADH) small chain
MVWPYWPMIHRTSSSHEEGVKRDFAVSTKRFIGEHGRVKALHLVHLDWRTDAEGRKQMVEVPGSETVIPADLVLLAMGFLGPERKGLITDLEVACDARGNIACDPTYRTSVPRVFACGDAQRGQSLVVWAIWEGRECARSVDLELMGKTQLPSSPAGPETGGRSS